MDKIGATGQFPKGKLNKEDEGALAMAVASDFENRKVMINFGKPVEWLGLDPEDAVQLARMLMHKASEVKTKGH